MEVPLPHPRAETFALRFAEVGPAGAEVAVHAALPAVLHAFTHLRAPARATRQQDDADADEKQGPEQMEERWVDEAEVLEQLEHADSDEHERKNAHGFSPYECGACA